MKVQIWSDVMCPFCYIAKNNFEKAVKQLPFAGEIKVEWKSFQLDPELKETSGNKTFGQYLMERKGFSSPQTDQFLKQLSDMGRNSGVDFNHDRTFVANTFSAHKLLHLAKSYVKDNEMEELLFRALFEDGKNIADTDLLVSLAEQLGIDIEEAKEAITSDRFEYDVKQDVLEANNLGISGVPFFILNNKYSVSGAQPVDAFVSALTKTYTETVKPLENLGGGDRSCTTDGCDI